MRDAAVAAERLTKRFAGVTALDDVTFELPAGGVLGLLGPNGAGKTTAVRILATLLAPDSGQARVAGLDVVAQAASVRRLIGLSGQYAAVDPFLTGRENLVMIGRLQGLGRRAAHRRAAELLDRLGLIEAADRQARTYSGGMRRRLDVAAGLVAAPLVLFLDEPTTGLDPEGRLALWQLLGELTAQGTSLLLTTQYLEEADQLATSIVVLGHGRLIASGTPSQIKARSGGDRLEVTVPPGDDPGPVARALAGLGAGPSVVDGVTGRVVVPVAAGVAILPELAARLAASNLRVAEVALRQPTMEEAFLALTRQPGPGTALPGPAGNRPAGSPGGAGQAKRRSP
jgi:ABC-2 type transport system ATP-binding protein